MISLTKVNKATKDFIKVLRFGNKDYQTAEQHLPAGIDSKPLKDDIASHSTTQNRSEPIIFGYEIKSDKTKPGEIRIYARNESGEDVFDLLLKEDGTAEFGGNNDNLVRYLKLNEGMQNFITDLNSKLVTAFSSVGGSWPGTSIDITASKIDEIKSL